MCQSKKKHAAISFCERFGKVAIAGTGFLADAYDLFVINIAMDMMKQNDYGVVLTDDIKSTVSLMAVLGAMFGQIFFGLTADQFGRRIIFIITCGLIIGGTLLSAAVQPNKTFNIYQQMSFFRFCLGFGVGGEYPLSSTITAEGSASENRDTNLAMVFSMQGVGKLLCAVVLMFCANVITDTNWQWRVAILVGAMPMMCAAYFRWQMHESEVYTKAHVESKPLAERFQNILRLLWDNKKLLAGTAGSWFILDVLFYGNSLFSADVTRAMGTEHTLQGKVRQNAVIQAIAMPGYIMAVLFLKKIGKKRLQLIGFGMTTFLFMIMAIAQSTLANYAGLYIMLYALTFFFDDFGANTTTFIIPSEVFPTEARATCHGLSAAAGKLGAVIGVAGFLKLQNTYCPKFDCTNAPESQVEKGLKLVFWVCAALGAVGFVWTQLLVTDKPHSSLDDSSVGTYDDNDSIVDTGSVELGNGSYKESFPEEAKAARVR